MGTFLYYSLESEIESGLTTESSDAPIVMNEKCKPATRNKCHAFLQVVKVGKTTTYCAPAFRVLRNQDDMINSFPSPLSLLSPD